MREILLLLLLDVAIQAGAHGKEKVITPKLSGAALSVLHPKKEKNDFKGKDLKQVVTACLKGYTLRKDDKCFKQINVPAVPTSPEVEIPYILQCPVGYHCTDGDMCSRTQEVPPEFFCPVGSVDEGNACVTTAIGETVPFCEVGELQGNQCVLIETTKPLLRTQCPDGSQVEKDGKCWQIVGTYECTEEDGKKCAACKRMLTHDEPKPVHPKCLDGKDCKVKEKCEGKKCKDSEPQIYAVEEEMYAVPPPRAFKVEVARKVCEKKVEVEPLAIIYCPPGFVEADGQCVRETTNAPVNVCAATGQVGPVCPPAIKRIPKYRRCPPRTATKHGKCLETSVVPMTKTCGKGFTDNGNGCAGIIPEDLGLDCPPALTLMGDRCVGESIRPAVKLTVISSPLPPC